MNQLESQDTSTLIDVILTNDPSHVAMSTSIPCDISNHNIIGYVRKINFKRFSPKVISFRDYKNYDIKGVVPRNFHNQKKIISYEGWAVLRSLKRNLV